MIIIMTLGEVIDSCKDWDYFCEQEGWSVFACQDGGSDVEVRLSKEQAIKYGIIKE